MSDILWHPCHEECVSMVQWTKVPECISAPSVLLIQDPDPPQPWLRQRNNEWMNVWIKTLTHEPLYLWLVLHFPLNDSQGRKEASDLTLITEMILYTDYKPDYMFVFHGEHIIIQWCKSVIISASQDDWSIPLHSEKYLQNTDSATHSSKISSMPLVRKAKRYNTLL